MLSTNQTFGQVEHPLRVISSFDIDLFTEAVAPLVAGPQLLVLFRGHVIVAIQIHVAVPSGDESQRAQVGITSASSDRNVKDVDARILESLKIGWSEAVRI